MFLSVNEGCAFAAVGLHVFGHTQIRIVRSEGIVILCAVNRARRRVGCL